MHRKEKNKVLLQFLVNFLIWIFDASMLIFYLPKHIMKIHLEISFEKFYRNLPEQQLNFRQLLKSKESIIIFND